VAFVASCFVIVVAFVASYFVIVVIFVASCFVIVVTFVAPFVIVVTFVASLRDRRGPRCLHALITSDPERPAIPAPRGALHRLPGS